MQITLDTNISHLQKQAQATLNRYFEQFQQSQVLFLVSSGSALALLDGIKIDHLGENVTITMADERYTPDPTINNFSQLMDTKFYAAAQAKGCRFINTQLRPNEAMGDLASRWEMAIKAWLESNPDRVALSTLGMGADGHIAGISPYPDNPTHFNELFDQENKWVVGYNAQGRLEHPLRVTVTLPFLRHYVDYAVLYAVGKEKHSALQRLVASEGTLAETPARITKQMQHVELFTDDTSVAQKN